ncbi:hypothetical protein FPZ54_02020 [Sphingomonas suaedae]|uniref:Uncharacterized protein n=1 Tax=Sphingomonas suaedae TaxID=2599297 RepID=A0A518RBU0_9SPHN|nr:hypothetical protein [Sphingomonas suaedae]QDX24925.1 hypothetical protein FPZ54_02020 [Sphingomonas suaedae]
MGYDLHIHRRKDWLDEGDDIELTEWEALCRSDASLEITGEATATIPQTGDVIRLSRPGMAVWTAATGSTWFWLDRGEVTTSGADSVVIAKSCEIAEALGARVQGDDGEFYRPDGSYFHDDD